MSATESTRPVCAIYWDGDGAVISEHQCWRPGSFADPETARHGMRFDDTTLSTLSRIARVDNRGSITRAMLDDTERAGVEPNDVPRVVVMSGHVIGHEVIVEADAPMPVTFPWVKS